MIPRCISRIVSLALLLAAACAIPFRADCVNNRIILLFPKNVSEFACANLDEALSRFADFKGQVRPRQFYGFDQFLVPLGINPNTQVNQVVWSIGAPAPNAKNPSDACPNSGQFLAIVVGKVDSDSVKSALAESML